MGNQLEKQKETALPHSPSHIVHTGKNLLEKLRKGKKAATNERPESWKEMEPEIIHSITEENYITSGGFANVYKVEILDRLWIVKKSKNPFYKEKKLEAEREVEIMTNSNYRHENLMCAEHSFFHEGHLYIVMEKMDGSLDNLLYSKDEQIQKLKALLGKYPSYLLYLLIQIAKGIQKLHSVNICHRDIKPENVLLSKKVVDGRIEIGKVKLSDFGISKEGGSFSTVGIGTMHYMAPEIKNASITGIKYSRKADVYSFGILLGELVCGLKPVNIVVDYSYSKFEKAGYATLYNLYKKCTQEEPNDRPDIDHVLQDLELQMNRLTKRNDDIDKSARVIEANNKQPQVTESQKPLRLTSDNKLSTIMDESASPVKIAEESWSPSRTMELPTKHRFSRGPSGKVKFKFKTKFGSYGTDNGQFDCPYFITTSSYVGGFNIFICDTKNHRIQIFDSNGNWKHTFIPQVQYGNLRASYNTSTVSQGYVTTPIRNPMGIAVNSKNHLIIAEYIGRIHVYDANLQHIMSIHPNNECKFSEIKGIAVDAWDNILIIDGGNHRILVFNSNGACIASIGKKGSGNGEFEVPWAIAVSKKDNKVFVSDSKNSCVQVFGPDGSFLLKIGSEGKEDGQLCQPRGLAVSNCGQFLYVCDTGNHRIQRFNVNNGTFHKRYDKAGVTEASPNGICITTNRIIVSNCSAKKNLHFVQIFGS